MFNGLFSVSNLSIIGAAFFLCALLWLFLPIVQVKRSALPLGKDRLELEDAFRKTLGQALASIGFLLTFGLSIAQFLANQASSQRDFELKVKQDLTKEYDDASTLLKTTSEGAQLIQAIAKLERTALSTDSKGIYLEPAQDQLAGFVVQRTQSSAVNISNECQPRPASVGTLNGSPSRNDREGFDALALVAFRALNRISKVSKRPISLSHLYFDNIDLNGISLSARADFSQSSFRRANLRDTSLVGASFAGAKLADFDVPGFTAAIGEALEKQTLEEWQRYRCWVSDFRGADLTDARFDGAGLGGVVFRGAILRGAKFDGANVSRADFTNTDITTEQLKWTCADAPIVSGIKDFQPPRCQRPQ